MSGRYMRKLLEAVNGVTTNVSNIINELEQKIANYDMNDEDPVVNMSMRGELYPVRVPHEKYLQDLKKSLTAWKKLEDKVEPLTRAVPVNPENSRTSKTFGGTSNKGITSAGIDGDPQRVLQWLEQNMRAKGNAVKKNLNEMERLSPEDIDWEYGLVEIKPTHGGSGSEHSTRPGANVLFIGETEEGDDVRFVFYQGFSSQGSARAAIVHGEEYKSGKFDMFAQNM